MLKDGNVQKFLVETDSKDILKKYLSLALPTILSSCEEIAVKIVDHDDKYKTLYFSQNIHNEKNSFPIILISGWYKPKGFVPNSYFNGYKPWFCFDCKSEIFVILNYIIDTIITNKDDLKERFLKLYGNGYDIGFSPSDGHTDIGYKLESNDTFPHSLTISLTHIYYGN